MTDTTDRKIIEKNLNASEEKLQQILSSMAESFYVIDKNYHIILINKVAESNLEKAWGYHVTVGTNILDHIPAERDEPIKSSLNKVFAGEKVEYELHLSLRDLPSWLLVTYTPVYDEDKSIIGACIVTKDITERKKGEEQIRQRENNFRQLVDTAPDATVLFNEKGIIQIVNRQTEILLNYQREELIGKPVEILIPVGLGDTHSSHGQKVHKEIKTRPIGMGKELFAFKKDGTKVPVEISLSPFHSDEGILVTASVRDITDRKKTEDALQKSNTRFELISSTTNDAVWDWNLETGELWSNQMHQHLYGLTLSDPVPTEKMWAERIHPDDRQVMLKKQKETLTSDKNVFISEYRFKVEGKNYRDIYDRCYIVRNKEGKPVRMMGSMMDITDRKKTEEQLKESEERYRLLIEQASDAIMITDQKGNFIDINSSFCNMFGYTKNELLQLDIRALIDPEQLQKEPMRFERLAGGEQIFSQRRMIHKNGTIIEVEANVKMLPDGRILAIARDITDRKKAEQAIRTSEETRRLIMNSALDAIVCMDTAGIITVWTPQAEKIFGWKEQEALGKSLAETIIPLQYREKHKKGLQHYFETGKGPVINRLIEITALNKNGKEFPVELSIIPIRQGGDQFFCGFVRDITERKKAADQIIRERDLSDSVINSLPGVFYLQDATGKYLRWNKIFEDVSGYTVQEIMAMHPLDFFEEEEKQKVSKKIEKVFSNGYAEIETVVITRHGKRIPYFFTGQLIQYEGKPCLIGTGIDVTERKKAEDALKESEKKYRSLIEQAADAIFLADEKTNFIDVNPSACKLLGYSREELLTMNISNTYSPEELKKNPLRWDLLLANKTMMNETKLRRKDGSEIPVEINSKVLDDGRYQAIVRDITERKKAHDELEQSYKAIRQLSDHLQKIREEERTSMAREIHDELGQQLTVLKMDISWLNKKLNLADETIKHKLKSLNEMLDGTVKTVRRISSELRPSLLDDMGLIAAIEWQLNEFEQRSGIRTSLSAPEIEKQLPDSVRTGLFRIFQESLTNIARHANAKSVKVRLQHKKGKIVLSIEDDGKGFDKKKTAAKRTLGILGMRERTLMIGGEYEIKSMPGKGTTVLVAIPEQV
jgi:PAS domain S-box-containing protein